jgi:hypothetical protein
MESMTEDRRLQTDDTMAAMVAKQSIESILADAHNLPDDLPGDELGGGFENGEQLVPKTQTAATDDDTSAS